MRKAFIASLALGVAVSTSMAQVLVNETFSYGSLADMQLNWGTNAALTLDTTLGNPSPSAAHSGAAVVSTWRGSTFSITPTDANPIQLTADIYSTGIADQSNTVGLRTGANPLFEMGMYRFFDNNFENSNETALSLGSGHGVRTINLGKPLPGQNWTLFGPEYTGWARWEATFGTYGVTVRVDYGITGEWDITFSEIGTTATGAFSDLRIHSPVASPNGGFNVDNIRLEVIPEPSSFVLAGLGAAALLIFRRRK
jgi:hypothetical protein